MLDNEGRLNLAYFKCFLRQRIDAFIQLFYKSISICASIATKCQHQSRGPEVNKFEQVAIDGHQMSRAWGSLRSNVWRGAG